MADPRVILQYPMPGLGRRWVAFGDPRQVVVANSIAQVAPALQEIESLTDAGAWAAGFVSYDASPAFDEAIVAHRDPSTPLVWFGVFDAPTVLDDLPTGAPYELTPWKMSLRQGYYEQQISQIRDMIRSGITYQVNHTFRLDAQFAGDPLGLFSDLARAQQASHSAFVECGPTAICSASPELFFRKVGRYVTSRPMKGTAPRHPDPEWDELAAHMLSVSEKDRAENTMIVDMVRNDLGRIAEPGTVQVTALHTIERYPTVHQMTSTVEAQTDAGIADIFRALFPAASITGAPKVRTTQIIHDLEDRPRGIYTGCVGAIQPGGDAEFNIAIRTVRVNHATGKAVYGVGGGIVWDSDPYGEWKEAQSKARVLERARPGFRLLETIAWNPDTGASLLTRHLDRAQRSAEHFGFSFDRPAAMDLLLRVEADVPVKLRLLISPDGRMELEQHNSPAEFDGTIAVRLDDRPIHSGDEFLYHKTTNRATYEDARGRFPEFADVILWNENGEVTETTIGNIVVEIDGEFITPPVTSGLLAGTFRAELLEAGVIAERIITRDQLLGANWVWMINSVRGWVRIQPVGNTIELGPVPELESV